MQPGGGVGGGGGVLEYDAQWTVCKVPEVIAQQWLTNGLPNLPAFLSSIVRALFGPNCSTWNIPKWGQGQGSPNRSAPGVRKAPLVKSGWGWLGLAYFLYGSLSLSLIRRVNGGGWVLGLGAIRVRAWADPLFPRYIRGHVEI